MQNLATTVRIVAYTSSTECIQWKSKPFGIDFTDRYLLRRTASLLDTQTDSFFLLDCQLSGKRGESIPYFYFVLLFLNNS